MVLDPLNVINDKYSIEPKSEIWVIWDHKRVKEHSNECYKGIRRTVNKILLTINSQKK